MGLYFLPTIGRNGRNYVYIDEVYTSIYYTTYISLPRGFIILCVLYKSSKYYDHNILLPLLQMQYNIGDITWLPFLRSIYYYFWRCTKNHQRIIINIKMISNDDDDADCVQYVYIIKYFNNNKYRYRYMYFVKYSQLSRRTSSSRSFRPVYKQ